MEETLRLLAALFFITALLYAAVGFGGGSTYNALLVLQGVDYKILPAIALVCNIIVVAGGVWRFGAAGHLSVGKSLPWIVASTPFAWLGGRLEISETVFVGLLGGSLLAAGVRLLLQNTGPPRTDRPRMKLFFSLPAGAGLGFLSGLVGIGGGIFLAPILHLARWGSAKSIAATCSLFILINSLSGLTGQLQKLSGQQQINELATFWPLAVAVLVGGQIGSRLGTSMLSEGWIRRMTGVLILYVAVRLLLKWASMLTTIG